MADEVKKIDYRDFFSDDGVKTVQEYIKVFNKLDAEFSKLATGVKASRESIDKELGLIQKAGQSLGKDFEGFKLGDDNATADIAKMRKQIDQLKSKIKELKNEQIELTAQEKELEKQRKKQTRLLAQEAIANSKVVKETEKLSIEIQQQTRDRKKLLRAEIANNKASEQEIKIVKAQNGSMNELGAVLSINSALYNSLSKEQRENTEEGKKLGKIVGEQAAELNKLKKEVNDNTSNIGNYKEGVIGAIKESIPFSGVIDGMREKMLLLKSATGIASTGLGKLKLALLASGIGAVVVVLGALAKGFKKSQEGSEGLRRGAAALGGAWDYFTGSVARALTGVNKSMEKSEGTILGYFKNIKKAMDSAANLEDLIIANEKLVKSLERSSSAYKMQAKLFTDIQEDDARGFELRKDAAEEAQKAIKLSFDDEIKLIQRVTEVAKKRVDEAKRVGINATEAENDFQEVLKQNLNIEAEYIDFIRNQAELRLKVYSDEAESKIDIAVLFNESLKNSQRSILDNEKSSLKERTAAQEEFSKTQQGNLKLAKDDVTNYIEFSRDEGISLYREQIDAIKQTAKAQKRFTAEQLTQLRFLEDSLNTQLELKEQGFDIDKILNQTTLEGLQEQFVLQDVNEKFRLRIIELLQLQKDQELELTDIIKNNVEKQKMVRESELKFRLETATITNKQITELAKNRLKEENSLLKNGKITQQEFNNELLEEEKRINGELLSIKEEGLETALNLRAEYGLLSAKEIDRLAELQLKKERELLESKLITIEEFERKKQEIIKSYSGDEKEKRRLKSVLDFRQLSIIEAGRLADLELSEYNTLLENKLITEEQYQKKRTELITKYTDKNKEIQKNYSEQLQDAITKGTLDGFTKNIATNLQEQEKLFQEGKISRNQLLAERVKAEVIKAALTVFNTELSKGSTVAEAFSKSAKAGGLAGVIASTSGLVAKKDGGTVMGGEQIIRVNEEGQEFVVDAPTTKALGLDKNASMSDFHSKVLSPKNEGYTGVMSNFNTPSINVLKAEPVKIDYEKMGKEVGKNIPSNNFDVIGKHFVHREKRGNDSINTIYKSKKQHLPRAW